MDIPRGDGHYDEARDCAPTRYGDCVVRALEQFRVILADPATRDFRRLDALRFVVHLVGDLHQPLHTIDDHDRGGNDVQIEFMGKPGNLHSLWDYMLIESTGVSEADYAKRLLGELTAEQYERMAQGTVLDWVMESYRVALAHAYVLPEDHKLGVEYRDRNMPVIDLQILRAGVRLARVLNEALR